MHYRNEVPQSSVLAFSNTWRSAHENEHGQALMAAKGEAAVKSRPLQAGCAIARAVAAVIQRSQRTQQQSTVSVSATTS